MLGGDKKEIIQLQAKISGIPTALLFSGIMKQLFEISWRCEGESCFDICRDTVVSSCLWGWKEIHFFSPLEQQCISLKNTEVFQIFLCFCLLLLN